MAGPCACRSPELYSRPGPGLHHMAAGAATSFTVGALGAIGAPLLFPKMDAIQVHPCHRLAYRLQYWGESRSSELLHLDLCA